MRKTLACLFLVLPLTVLVVSGCAGRPTEQPKAGETASLPDRGGREADNEAALRANLEKLSREDRSLAKEQSFCAVETRNALGSMGVPVKVLIQEQPVFLCCDACETRAKAHADRTLARVQQLKEKRAGQSGK